MKKLLFLFLLLPFLVKAQVGGPWERVITKSMYLGGSSYGRYMDSLLNDTSSWIGKVRSYPTAHAIAMFVAGRTAGVGNPYIDSIFYSSGDGVDTLKYNKSGDSFTFYLNDILFNGRLTGGSITPTGSGLTYDVSAAVYRINGIRYTSNAASVSSSAADGSLPRIDIIVADIDGVISVIEGIPATNPVPPNYDPATQIFLGFVDIPATATSPGQTSTKVYDENNEGWTWTTSAASINANFTGITAQLGDTLLNVGTIAHAQYIELTKNSGQIDITNMDQLSLFFRGKMTMPQLFSLRVSLWNGGTQVSNEVIVGIDKYNSTSWQGASIPKSLFAVTNNLINKIRFRIINTGPTITYTGFYLDNIFTIDGVAQSPGIGVTASEGLTKNVDDIQLGGPISSPATFTTERVINTKRKIMHWTNGALPASGGPSFLPSFPANINYSPFQFISSDTITANDLANPTIDVPYAGVFASRQMYYADGIIRNQKMFGHSFGTLWNWKDSISLDTRGGDYNTGFRIDNRLMPRGTGRQGIRASHGTGQNLSINYGAPALLVNTTFNNSAGNYINVNGHLTGVNSYLLMGNYNPDTLSAYVYYTTGNFISSTSRVGKSYDFAPSAYSESPRVDSVLSWFDTTRRKHFYHAGNALIGVTKLTSHTWSSTDKFKVVGNVNITDSLKVGNMINWTDSTNIDVVLSPRTAGSHALRKMRFDQLASLIASSSPTPSLQEVLDVDNTATATNIFMNQGHIINQYNSVSPFFQTGISFQSGTSQPTSKQNFLHGSPLYDSSIRFTPGGASAGVDLDGGLLTTYRRQKFPDKNGTFAMLSDISDSLGGVGGGGITTIGVLQTIAEAKGLSISNDTLYGHYATSTTHGMVKPGTNLGVSAGVLSASMNARVNSGGSTYSASRLNFIGTGGVTVTGALPGTDIDITIDGSGIGGGSTETASRGLNKSLNDIRWGGSLDSAVVITSSDKTISFSGTSTGTNSILSIDQQGTTQYGTSATSVSGSAFRGFTSNGGYTFEGQIGSATTNTVLVGDVIRRNTTGTAANGLGVKKLIQLEAADGSAYESNGFISRWLDATARTSELDITGSNAATIEVYAKFKTGGVVIVNNGADTLATKADARLGGGGSYTDEQAQDAVGAMVDGSLNYIDATPLLQRAALTGDVTASAGSNATTIASLAVTNAKINDVAWTKVTGTPTTIAGYNISDAISASSTNTFTNKTIDADGTGNSITNIENADIKAAAGIALNKLAATTASRALVSDGSGFVSVAATTATEIGYVSGATSNIQTQLDAKATVSLTKGFFEDVLTVAGVTTTLDRVSNHGFWDDFIGAPSTTVGTTHFNELITGSGSNASLATAASGITGQTGFGYAVIETGTATTGKAALSSVGLTNINTIGFVNNDYYIRHRYQDVIINDLSDGTNTYTATFGIAVDNAVTNSVVFTYTHGTNSGNWVCLSHNGATAETTNTSVAVAADTEVDLDVELYNGVAKFYIDGTLVATHSTQVPAGGAVLHGSLAKILKSAGATSRQIFIGGGGVRVVHENNL